MPVDSPFSQRITLTQTRNPAVKNRQPPWLFTWPRPTLSPSSLVQPPLPEPESGAAVLFSSRNSQCLKCWKFGHISNRCPRDLPVCPFCSLAHTKAEHRCPNPSCPKGGNLRPMLPCSPSSMACCANSQEEHCAHGRDCPSRPKTIPDAPKVLSRQRQDSMDLAKAQAGPSTIGRPTQKSTSPDHECPCTPPRCSAT